MMHRPYSDRVKDPIGRLDTLAFAVLERVANTTGTPVARMAFKELSGNIAAGFRAVLGPQNQTARQVKRAVKKVAKVMEDARGQA